MRSRFTLTLLAAVVSTLLLTTPQDSEARGRFKISGHFNEAYTNLKFKRIVVAAPNVVPAFRAQIEKRMNKTIRKYSGGGAEGVRIEEILPTTKKYTDKDVINTLKANNIDAAIVVDIQQNAMRIANMPNNELIPEGMKQALTFAANHRHNPVHGAKYQPTTVRVYDVNSGGVVFEGSGFVNADTRSRKWHKLSGHFLATKIAKYLRKGRYYPQRAEQVEETEAETSQDVNFNLD